MNFTIKRHLDMKSVDMRTHFNNYPFPLPASQEKVAWYEKTKLWVEPLHTVVVQWGRDRSQSSGVVSFMLELGLGMSFTVKPRRSNKATSSVPVKPASAAA